MNIAITINDDSIKQDISRKINAEVDKVIRTTLEKIDINTIIEDRIKYHVDKSNQLTDKTLRNYVQQKIARELANTIFKEKNL